MNVAFRPALPEDFDYCQRLYFAEMQHINRELNLDRDVQVASFRRQWEVTQVRIVTLDGADIGWLQSTTRDGAFFLGQLFVDASRQRRGIGTAVMRRVIGEATRTRQAMTLGVVKSNPAKRLYDRLGFHVTHEDDRKFYMRREPDVAPRNQTDQDANSSPPLTSPPIAHGSGSGVGLLLQRLSPTLCTSISGHSGLS